MKVWRRFSHENGDCIFKLFSLLLEKNGLRSRGVQERLFFRDVQPGGHAAFMPRIHQLQALLQSLHGAIENSQLGVELPQREIITRQLRRDH